MIKYKTGICRLCGPDSKDQPLYARGLCGNHYWLNNQLEAQAKKNNQKSLVNQNPNPTDKQGLQEWFTYHIIHSGLVCENCGGDLYFPDNTIAFSCQAHIVPKSLFPSVAANIYNHLTLGGLFQKCSCHGQYDTNWMNAEKMPVFELAKQRFLLFKNDIARAELRRLPIQFQNLL